MKSFFILMIAVFISTALLADHSPMHKIARINEIQRQLDDADLVETAMFEAMQSMMHHPRQVIPGLKEKLERIATGAFPKATRYKAELALQFLQHPDWFSRFASQHFSNKNIFFRQMLGAYPNGFLR